MNKLIKLAAFTAFLAFAFHSYSSHYMGGEVTYQYLDANGPAGNPFRYRITFNIYIYCGPGSEYEPHGNNGDISMGIFDAVTGTRLQAFDNANNVTRYSHDLSNVLTDVTPDVPPGCNIPGISNNCIKLNKYETTVNLPLSINGYLVVHERCCRNNQILNLNDAGEQAHALFTKIPPSIYKNSSPQFTNIAIPAICIGDTITIVNNAYDPDGDFLQYEFIAPPRPNLASQGNAFPNFEFVNTYFEPTSTLSYNSGYSETQPFGPGDYAFIDGSTGLTRYLAPNAGNYVVVVKISEYRDVNGTPVLLSSTRRDIQFVVSNQCPPNNTPSVVSVENSNNKFINIYEGDSINLSFQASDVELHNISLSASGPIFDPNSGYTGPLATFTLDSNDNTKAYFNWKTECGMRGSYNFTITAKDNGCPPKTFNTIYTVNILPFTIGTLSGPDSVCILDINSRYSVPSKTGSNYVWSIVNGTVSGLSTSGARADIDWGASGFANVKVVETSALGCKDSTEKVVYVRSIDIIEAFGDTVICSGDTIDIYTNMSGSWQWSPSEFVLEPSAASTQAFPDSSTFFVLNSLTSRCFLPDTVTVSVNQFKADAGSDLSVCMRDSLLIGVPETVGFTYSWSPSEGLVDSNSAQPILVLNKDSIYSYIATIRDTNLCVSKDTILITVLPAPDSVNISGAISVCPDVTGINYLIEDTTIIAFDWTVDGGTLVFGQNTDSILVDWGGSSNNASVNIVPVNTFGCVGDTSKLPILINLILQTETPNGPNELCFFDIDSVGYGIANVNGSVYTWQISGGIINSGQGSNAVNISWTDLDSAYVFIEEQVNTSSSLCFGRSDTLFVTVNASPDTTLSILGDNSVCAFTDGAVYSINGLSGSNYVWTVESGEIISGQGSNSVIINWDSTGTYSLSVFETSADGCEGSVIPDTIFVRSLPDTKEKSGTYTICPQNLEGFVYEVEGFANSTFQWFADNAINIINNGSSSATIDWDTAGQVKTIRVLETTEYGCTSDTLVLSIIYDPSNIFLNVVSDQFNNEELVELKWLKYHFFDSLTENLKLYRRTYLPSLSNWEFVTDISKNETSYIDGPLATKNNSYQYYLSTSNMCKDSIVTEVHNNILLNISGSDDEVLTSLNWSHYKNWADKNAVSQYEIYRKLDGSAYELYSTVSANDSTVAFDNGRDGFVHCYRVKAILIENPALFSWSNEVCITYKHLIHVRNALSPNGDDKNDYFFIDNIEFYPDNTVEIYNRWGNLVYNTSGYQNNWDGDKLPDGTYFAVIKVIVNNEEMLYKTSLLIQR